MKSTTVPLILALATSVVAAAAAVTTPIDNASSIATRDANCDSCFDQYNFCVRNGHTNGQEGCNQTCAEHVCHVNRHDPANPRECRGCGGDFKMCPEESRYV